MKRNVDFVIKVLNQKKNIIRLRIVYKTAHQIIVILIIVCKKTPLTKKRIKNSFQRLAYMYTKQQEQNMNIKKKKREESMCQRTREETEIETKSPPRLPFFFHFFYFYFLILYSIYFVQSTTKMYSQLLFLLFF